jgi:hypothetical protein
MGDGVEEDLGGLRRNLGGEKRRNTSPPPTSLSPTPQPYSLKDRRVISVSILKWTFCQTIVTLYINLLYQLSVLFSLSIFSSS